MCPGATYIGEIDPNAVPTPRPRRERLRPGAPWFNDEIKKEKLLRRKVPTYVGCCPDGLLSLAVSA